MARRETIARILAGLVLALLVMVSFGFYLAVMPESDRAALAAIWKELFPAR